MVGSEGPGDGGERVVGEGRWALINGEQGSEPHLIFQDCVRWHASPGPAVHRACALRTSSLITLNKCPGTLAPPPQGPLSEVLPWLLWLRKCCVLLNHPHGPVTLWKGTVGQIRHPCCTGWQGAQSQTGHNLCSTYF